MKRRFRMEALGAHNIRLSGLHGLRTAYFRDRNE